MINFNILYVKKFLVSTLKVQLEIAYSRDFSKCCPAQFPLENTAITCIQYLNSKQIKNEEKEIHFNYSL